MKCDKYDKCTYTDCGMCENCTNEMVQGLINKITVNAGLAQPIMRKESRNESMPMR